MIKVLLSGLSFLAALGLGWAAMQMYVRCILPWWKAPETTHITVMFAGATLTGWQILLPFGICVIAMVMIAIVGASMLRRGD